MAVKNFKVGDTVRLKSGGPLMTVTGVAKDDRDLVWVAWFEDNKPANGHYPEDALTADDGTITIV